MSLEEEKIRKKIEAYEVVIPAIHKCIKDVQQACLVIGEAISDGIDNCDDERFAEKTQVYFSGRLHMVQEQLDMMENVMSVLQDNLDEERHNLFLHSPVAPPPW